jgi:hypothetical protein
VEIAVKTIMALSGVCLPGMFAVAATAAKGIEQTAVSLTGGVVDRLNPAAGLLATVLG